MSDFQRPTWRVFIPWFMVAIAAFFYCYAYALRMYPSVMEPQLRHFFHIDATDFGNLTAFYYYAYTPMQLLVGLIIDRYGARLVLGLASILSTLGLFFFMSSHSLTNADAGRLILGAGAAFAYVTVLKLATLWLPPNRFAMVAGLTTAFGMLAAISTDLILGHIVQAFGFEHALHILLAIGIVLTLFVIVFVRNGPKTKQTHQRDGHDEKIHFGTLCKSLLKMFKNPQMWLVGCIGLLLYMPASVFLDTWGIPFIHKVYHLSGDQADELITLIFWGWICSSPFLGHFSDKIGRRKPLLFICSVSAAITITIAFYVPHLSVLTLGILFFLFGAFCGVHPTVFAISRENNPTRLSGTAVALTNTFIMIGGFVQPIVGILLDWHWSGLMQNGLRVYSSGDYRFALCILPIGLFFTAFLLLFVKETYCKLHEDK